MNNIIYWLWLRIRCGDGNLSAGNILTKFDNDPVKIYKAERSDYSDIEKLSPNFINALCDKNMNEANLIINYCKDNDVGIITLEDELYPSRLKNIPNKPILLFYAGRLINIEKRVCIAAVGTRKMTAYGENSAYRICYDLGRAGIVIVSGMANGIDSVCHNACIDAGGFTIAVLGCGIDRVYPSKNEELMRLIIKFGTVITEYLPGSPPIGYHFPMRNRIISGLSQGTFVIEGSETSGSMITAKYASIYGRDVFALPGKVGETNNTGTNNLIKNGAKMVTSASDILDVYEPLYPNRIKINVMDKNKAKVELTVASPKTINTKIQRKDICDIGEKNLKILELIPSDRKFTSDELTQSGFTISDIMVALTTLELFGFIEAFPGGYYIKK